MSFALAFLYQDFISLNKEESKAKTAFGGRVSLKAVIVQTFQQGAGLSGSPHGRVIVQTFQQGAGLSGSPHGSAWRNPSSSIHFLVCLVPQRL